MHPSDDEFADGERICRRVSPGKERLHRVELVGMLPCPRGRFSESAQKIDPGESRRRDEVVQRDRPSKQPEPLGRTPGIAECIRSRECPSICLRGVARTMTMVGDRYGILWCERMELPSFFEHVGEAGVQGPAFIRFQDRLEDLCIEWMMEPVRTILGSLEASAAQRRGEQRRHCGRLPRTRRDDCEFVGAHRSCAHRQDGREMPRRFTDAVPRPKDR